MKLKNFAPAHIYTLQLGTGNEDNTAIIQHRSGSIETSRAVPPNFCFQPEDSCSPVLPMHCRPYPRSSGPFPDFVLAYSVDCRPQNLEPFLPVAGGKVVGHTPDERVATAIYVVRTTCRARARRCTVDLGPPVMTRFSSYVRLLPPGTGIDTDTDTGSGARSRSRCQVPGSCSCSCSCAAHSWKKRELT